MINLNQFNHLVALAQECHFAQAAARVHLSQPAFSRSIQAAERQVGLRLFERQPGTVRLTPAGEFVIEKARRLLFDARCLERDIDLYRESGLGDTAFGLGPFPAATVLSELLTHIRKEHPRVGVQACPRHPHGRLLPAGRLPQPLWVCKPVHRGVVLGQRGARRVAHPRGCLRGCLPQVPGPAPLGGGPPH